MRHQTPNLHGFICLAIFSSALVAQKRAGTGMTSNTNLSQNFAFEPLTIEHGLPSNTVNSILQDSQGFLWFGTGNGLARYDGYNFKIYSHDIADSNSISNNLINAIFEDRSRVLWIGTITGLNRFDRFSDTFTRYFPASIEDSVGRRGHDVRAILEDRDGTLWTIFGSGAAWIGGLYKLDPNEQKFIRYSHDENNSQSISQNYIMCMVGDDSGALWLGTRDFGVDKFDPKSGTVVRRYRHDPKNPHSLSHDFCWNGTKDRDGNLWFACFGGGLNKYDSRLDGFIHYRHDPRNTNSLHSDQVLPIVQDSQGMIWVSNAVLSRLDPTTESFAHFRFSPRQNAPGSNFVPYSLQNDNAGNLWAGTNGNGVFRIDSKPRKFVHYQHDPNNPNSLIDNEIRIIYEDLGGNIWIGTRQNGLSQFNPATETFQHFSHDSNNQHSLSSNLVTAIYQDRFGTIWIGTREGLNRFDSIRQSFTRYQNDPANPYSLNDNRIHTIYQDRDDNLWIGTVRGGLNKFDYRTEKFDHFVPNPKAPQESRDNHIVRIMEDQHANLWIEAVVKDYLFDRKTGRFTLIEPINYGVGGWGKNLIEDRNGTIWGANYGLYKLDAEKIKFVQFRMIPPGSYYGRGHDVVYNWTKSNSYLDKDGMIWCGSQYGLHKFYPQQEAFVAHYYEKDGMSSNSVLRIIGDDEDRLWILTDRGLSIFDEKSMSGKQFTRLTAADGIINSPTFTNVYLYYSFDSFIKTRNGEIWWGGNNGIHRFYPNIKSTNPHVPALRLTGFRNLNTAFKLDTAITEIKTVALNYDENFFSFTFAAMDFTNPRQNQYAYKLEGFDRDWIPGGNKNEASYTNVPPDTYTFRVKGSNNDGVWNETGTSVQIIIAPPFWQTWWFRIAAVLAAIAVLAALYNYRVSKLLEIERTRLHIARDLHDDVGSSLSSIALTAELLQKESAMDSLANRQLARVHETAKKLSRNLKEIVWAIDPQRDKFDDLLLQLKDITEELLGQKGIAYTLDIPQDGLPQSLKMDFRRNLFLIYKEMLHNIVQHSAATKVGIMLTRVSGMLELQVADNGKGFHAAAAANGSGIKSMRARAAELKGTLEIDSLPERGTKMILTMRL